MYFELKYGRTVGSAHIQGCLHSSIIKHPSNTDEHLNDVERATLALENSHKKLYFELLILINIASGR